MTGHQQGKPLKKHRSHDNWNPNQRCDVHRTVYEYYRIVMFASDIPTYIGIEYRHRIPASLFRQPTIGYFCLPALKITLVQRATPSNPIIQSSGAPSLRGPQGRPPPSLAQGTHAYGSHAASMPQNRPPNSCLPTTYSLHGTRKPYTGPVRTMLRYTTKTKRGGGRYHGSTPGYTTFRSRDGKARWQKRASGLRALQAGSSDPLATPTERIVPTNSVSRT